MANLKELRNRITSVSSTKQITSAMKMVSAAKLKRAQNAITHLRPYAQKLEQTLVNVSSTLDVAENPLGRPVENPSRVLLVAVSSNRGLAGAFNANILKRCMGLINHNREVQYEVLAIGKKVNDLLQRREQKIIGQHNAIYDSLTYDATAEIAEALIQRFREGRYDRIVLIYNQFVNAAVQKVQEEQFLPIRQPEPEDPLPHHDYIYDSGREELLAELVPLALKNQLYKALLDSNAAEHGARMTAMHKATDNANDLLRDLRLDYNKARQAAITNEILEIVGGAEALNA